MQARDDCDEPFTIVNNDLFHAVRQREQGYLYRRSEDNPSSELQTHMSNISSKFKSSPSSSSGSALTWVKEALGELNEADGANAETDESPTTKRIVATENFMFSIRSRRWYKICNDVDVMKWCVCLCVCL